jgi:predicted molibdopterin-dependent oxidoreductase YjgC
MLDMAKVTKADVVYDLGSGDGRTVITAAKRGAKLIVMDPRGHALKRHAWQMMQFKNGADVAMLNAMLNVASGAAWVAVHNGVGWQEHPVGEDPRVTRASLEL